MKRKLTFVFSIGAILVLLALNGCIPDGGTITPDAPNNEKPGEEGTFAGLSAKTERQMKLDYVQTYLDPASTTADDIQIYYYFGNYNGYEVAAFLTGVEEVHSKHDLNIVAVFGKGKAMMLFSRVIYNYDGKSWFERDYEMTGFQFPHPVAMLAWKPGENSESGHFYAMQEAYDLGLLTRNDIQSMYDLYYDMGSFEDLDEEETMRIVAWFWNNHWIYGEPVFDDFEGLFEDLSEERKSQVASTMWNATSVYTYLGTYHDYVILLERGVFEQSTYIQVYDFVFYYDASYYLMYAWHKGNGCVYIMAGYPEYKEIDYKDFLTEEDAKSMWERHFMRGKQY